MLAARTNASCAKGVLVKSSGYTQLSCVVANAMASTASWFENYKKPNEVILSNNPA